jgi:hypothetical protein
LICRRLCRFEAAVNGELLAGRTPYPGHQPSAGQKKTTNTRRLLAPVPSWLVSRK